MSSRFFNKNNSTTNLQIFLFFCFIIIFVIKLLNTLYLSSHTDPLNYHLAMTKVLLTNSFWDTYRFNTHFLMSGMFDYLYIIPNYLFQNKFFAQLTGQLMHFNLSLGLGALIIFKKIKNPTLALLGAIVLITLARSSEDFLVAKNDGMLASMALLTSIYIIESNDKHPAIVGLLLGLLPAIKMTGIFLSIPLGLIYVFQNSHSIRNILCCLFMALLAWSPILLRNYYFLQNPFFPGLVKTLPGSIHPQAYNYYTSLMGSSFSITSLWPQIKACFFSKIIFYLLPFAIFYNYKGQKKLNLYIIVIVVFLMIYFLTNGGVVYPRFFFSCHFILAYYLAATLIPLIPRLKPVLIIFLLLLIICDSKIDKNIGYIKKGYHFYANARSIKDVVNTMIPFTNFWDHIEKPTTEKIFVLSNLFTQFYYAPANVYLEQPEHNFMADFLNTCETSDLHKLKRYSYAILTPGNGNPCYKKIEESGIKGPTILGMTFYNLKTLSK